MGKFCESKLHLECAGEPGRLVKPRCRHFTNWKSAAEKEQGVSQDLGLEGKTPGGVSEVMLPAGGRDESSPEVFSAQGFSSQVRILALKGKACSRPCGNPEWL